MDTETKDTEDPRLTIAREYAAQHHDGGVRLAMSGLIDFAEERLRVNVGLVQENAELRRKVRDLSQGATK